MVFLLLLAYNFFHFMLKNPYRDSQLTTNVTIQLKQRLALLVILNKLFIGGNNQIKLSLLPLTFSCCNGTFTYLHNCYNPLIEQNTILTQKIIWRLFVNFKCPFTPIKVSNISNFLQFHEFSPSYTSLKYCKYCYYQLI